MKAANSIARLIGGDGCDRINDHRVHCSEWHEEWPDVGEPYDWTEYYDFVLAGYKLYKCDETRPCRTDGEPLDLWNVFSGRTGSGRAQIAVGMAARGLGGYFVPHDFSAIGPDVGISVPCKFADGHVEARELGIEGLVRHGRIHAREAFKGEDLDEGETVLRRSAGVARLTGTVTRSRLTAVARLNEHFKDGTACSGRQRLSLRPDWKAPRYID